MSLFSNTLTTQAFEIFNVCTIINGSIYHISRRTTGAYSGSSAVMLVTPYRRTLRGGGGGGGGHFQTWRGFISHLMVHVLQ
jgi:hypothetical protein